MNIKPKENNIAWVSSLFQEYFDGVPVEQGQTLVSQKLEKEMNDFEIQEELKPTEVSLGDVYETLKTLDHDVWALFYVKDKNKVLRVVGVGWGSGGWGVGAFALGADGWGAGSRVFSRNSRLSEPLKSADPQALSPFESLVLEKLDRIAVALEKKSKKKK